MLVWGGHSLVIPGQIFLSPGGWVIVFVAIVEPFEPLGSFLDVMFGSLL
jgi:hypothetical protein